MTEFLTHVTVFLRDASADGEEPRRVLYAEACLGTSRQDPAPAHREQGDACGVPGPVPWDAPDALRARWETLASLHARLRARGVAGVVDDEAEAPLSEDAWFTHLGLNEILPMRPAARRPQLAALPGWFVRRLTAAEVDRILAPAQAEALEALLRTRPDAITPARIARFMATAMADDRQRAMALLGRRQGKRSGNAPLRRRGQVS